MKIAVLGVGQTKFGELWNRSLADLLAESQLAAIRDAGIAVSDIDAIFTGNMGASFFSHQGNIGALASSILNLSVPSVMVDGSCASGALAISAGIQAIQSGAAKIVLVNGVEKLTDVSNERATIGIGTASSYEWEQIHGATFPALNALIARLYMHTYGLTREQLAMVSVQNHNHGLLNPYAHIQKKISVEQVIQAPMIADPLTMFDCSPISDGAASIILCDEAVRRSSVYIVGAGSATDTLLLSERKDLLTWNATVEAAQKAYAMAGITPKDVDVVELHDGFSIVQILALEDLGFVKKGCRDMVKFTVNPSGGLKSRGHPVGATGVAQAVEIVWQLQGRCGLRQVKNACIGLTHNVGGCGCNAVVHVFRSDI